MPRAFSDSEGDSQKENQGVKMSKSRFKVKTEMGAAPAGSSTNRASSRVDTDDGSEDLDQTNRTSVRRGKKREKIVAAGDEEGGNSGGDEDSDEEEQESPNGRKRTRVNQNGDAVSVKREKSYIPRRVTLPRDRDGYVPGSIVRVQLENFVTYDNVEFRPGPNLNMILGPNGTGKSSIACALCIGLGGAPSILGRSSELNAFVKHGHEEGYVEIELKGKIGTPNLVIRRKINSKNKQSTFSLNGTVVSARAIAEHLAELNVQVGNLCSFLPQDRVSEFAQMTPQQLLKETQRTAGDENLTTWHNLLIEKGKEAKLAEESLQEEKKRVTSLEDKQKSLEKDVRRYRERRAIERQIELLELVLPYVEYRESKAVYDRAKRERRRTSEELLRLQRENKPLIDLQEELKKRCDDLEKKRESKKKQVMEKYKKTLSSIQSRHGKAANQAEEALDKIKYIKRQERELVKNKAKTKEDIAKFQHKVDNPPTHEDPGLLDQEMKEKKAEARELNVKRAELAGRVEALVLESATYERTIAEKNRELQELENASRQRVHRLSRWDKDCADVTMWLMKHRETNEFARRVELPAVVSVTVTDRRYVNAVEACFNANQLKTFVTHSEEDYRMFNRMFNDTPEALGRKARVTVWYRPRGQLLGPPVSPDELRCLGFDGYAIDYAECPEGLRWYLHKELNMHRTAVGLDARNVNETQAQLAFSRVGPDGRPQPNASYIAGDTLATVSRSQYGQQKTMTVTRNIRQAQNLNAESIDPSVRRAIDEQLFQADEQNKVIKAQMSELHQQDRALMEQQVLVKEQSKPIADRQDAVKRVSNQIQADKTKLETLKKKLEGYENQPSFEEERKKHKAKVEQTVKERTKILAEFVELTQTLIQEQAHLSTAMLEQIRLKADIDAIGGLCDGRTAELRLAKQAYDEASALFEDAKNVSADKLRIVTDKIAMVDDELKETFKAMEAEEQEKDENDRWTPEKVAAALETEQAKLDLNHATDANVIDMYEARMRQIENLKASVESKEKKCEKLAERIQKTKDSWYPALTGLVTAIGAKFSAAFDRIGRAGEIRIAQHEDYDKWAIEIFVKFREGEPLTLLNGQRQSGGERSLTTIMYLMSLTEHARAPFSLVDEINQGMDQEYERNVHDQLVNVTCNADSGQYFLITPKLLPGLSYHKGMRILCVNNGEWLPDTKGLGNMRRMIDHVVQRRRPLAS